jgi:hypothetical protein
MTYTVYIIFRFQGIFEINKVDMVDVEEGHEGGLFWKALDGKNDYGSLQEGKRDNTST